MPSNYARKYEQQLELFKRAISTKTVLAFKPEELYTRQKVLRDLRNFKSSLKKKANDLFYQEDSKIVEKIEVRTFGNFIVLESKNVR